MTKVKTHMMFQGDAKKAVDLYSSAFKDFEVGDVESYGEGAVSYTHLRAHET